MWKQKLIVVCCCSRDWDVNGWWKLGHRPGIVDYYVCCYCFCKICILALEVWIARLNSYFTLLCIFWLKKNAIRKDCEHIAFWVLYSTLSGWKLRTSSIESMKMQHKSPTMFIVCRGAAALWVGWSCGALGSADVCVIITAVSLLEGSWSSSSVNCHPHQYRKRVVIKWFLEHISSNFSYKCFWSYSVVILLRCSTCCLKQQHYLWSECSRISESEKWLNGFWGRTCFQHRPPLKMHQWCIFDS